MSLCPLPARYSTAFAAESVLLVSTLSKKYRSLHPSSRIILFVSVSKRLEILLQHLRSQKNHGALRIRENLANLHLILGVIDIHMAEHRLISHALRLVFHALDHRR